MCVCVCVCGYHDQKKIYNDSKEVIFFMFIFI